MVRKGALNIVGSSHATNKKKYQSNSYLNLYLL